MSEKDEAADRKLEQRFDELTRKVNILTIKVEKLYSENISESTFSLQGLRRIQKWSYWAGRSFLFLFFVLMVASFVVGSPRRVDLDTRKIHVTPEADLLSAAAIICVPVALIFILLSPSHTPTIKFRLKDDKNGS